MMLWSAFLTRTTRLFVAWVLCLAAAATALSYAWINLADPKRVDGNGGHVNIDFAGSWMLGRMLLAGKAAELYDRRAQDEVLERAYPAADQNPDEPLRDHERLAGMLVGNPESQLSGPLYPPIDAYFMAPLALLPPQRAYRTMQLLNLALAFLLGLGASAWSGGRIWWPVATLLLMLFPGFAGTINLGQNPLLSLALLGVGWWLASVARPGLGGIVWGCLAFKPVWAVTYFVAALASRRWRLAASMGATGLVLIALTLPLGGLRPWFDWLALGRIASASYARDKNWVLLSRDVQNLPRRYLLDFPAEEGAGTSRYGSLPDVLGVSLWASVVGVWVIGLWRFSIRAGNVGDGPNLAGTVADASGSDHYAGCFALLGAWLACWHFMYYDSLLAALPVFLLFRAPRRAGWVPCVALFLLVGCHYLWEVLDPKFLGPPSETLILLALWGWCLVKMPTGSAPPLSAERHP